MEMNTLDVILRKLLEYINVPNSFVEIIVKLIKVIILLIIIIVLNKFIPKLVNKIMNKFSKYFGNEARKLKTINFLLCNTIRFVIYFLGIFKILDIFNQPIQPILALSSVGGVALAFGSQSLVKDIITGIFILIEDQFFVGDLISIGTMKGTVENIGIRTVSIRSLEGDLHVIPNGEIKIVTNMSKDYRRIFLNIVVFYKENINDMITILNKVLQEYNELSEDLLEPPVILGVTNITENDFTIKISINCKVGSNQKVEISMRQFIKEKFDKKGINILNI